MLSQARKTVVAAALALTAGASTVQAYSLPSWNGMFSGSFTLLDPDGFFIESDPAVTGLVHWDSPTSTGAAILFPSSTFFGYMWSANIITLHATAPNMVHADMLWDWGPYTNNPVTMNFSMPVTGPYTYTLTTLDGDGDGIIGNAMDIGPFAGWNATLSGTVTTIPVDLSAFYCFDCWADPENHPCLQDGTCYTNDCLPDSIDCSPTISEWIKQQLIQPAAYTLAPVVPLPPAAWLLGSGIAGLLGMGRRLQSRKF